MSRSTEFQIDGHAIVLQNRINEFTGTKDFCFYIFNKDGKCVLMGDGEWKETLDEGLAKQVYQMYLNHQKRTEKLPSLEERMKADSKFLNLMKKYGNGF